jgi:hypothetical protein
VSINLADLDQFRKHPAPAGTDYPGMVVRLFSPDDDIHAAMVYVVEHTQVSLGAAMYGWDDEEVQQLFEKVWLDERLPTVLALDSSQAGGVHERVLLAALEQRLPPGTLGNDLVVGRSSKHAISHLKLIRSDDITIGGSTNLSTSGETLQNNEAIFVRSASYALETQAKIDLTASEMRVQMAARSAKQ